MDDTLLGLGILIGVIAIALFGGAQTANRNASNTKAAQEISIQQKIKDTEKEVAELKLKIQEEEDNRTLSPYRHIVSLNYGNRSEDPAKEYLVIKVSSEATTSVPLSGWNLESLSTGTSVSIPQGTYIYFSGMLNGEQDIVLGPDETAYLVTGYSPNGYSFKANKCSGYLQQFQTYVPYMSSNCPAAREENTSSIPRTVQNDACLDYIDAFPRCKTETQTLPYAWSSECKKFITEKLTYSSCVNTHKNDKDFYTPEWRIYLKRSSVLWKRQRETIRLKDSVGKVVSSITY